MYFVPQFSLINMNGRLYDPLIGRMLSPDNYVDDVTNTQSYRRCSYVANNPLKYTDPTGWNEDNWDMPTHQELDPNWTPSIGGGNYNPLSFSYGMMGHEINTW